MRARPVRICHTQQLASFTFTQNWTQVPDHVVAAAAGALQKAWQGLVGMIWTCRMPEFGIRWLSHPFTDECCWWVEASRGQVALEPKSHPVHAYVVGAPAWHGWPWKQSRGVISELFGTLWRQWNTGAGIQTVRLFLTSLAMVMFGTGGHFL